MSRRNGTFVVAAVLLAAFLPTAPQTLAGEHVRSGHQVVIQSLPAPVSGVRPAAATVNISIAAAAPAPTANEAAYVNLRGPNGQLRRFAVVGGPEALSSRVIVLRPGESLTIRLTANK